MIMKHKLGAKDCCGEDWEDRLRLEVEEIIDATLVNHVFCCYDSNVLVPPNLENYIEFLYAFQCCL